MNRSGIDTREASADTANAKGKQTLVLFLLGFLLLFVDLLHFSGEEIRHSYTVSLGGDTKHYQVFSQVAVDEPISVPEQKISSSKGGTVLLSLEMEQKSAEIPAELSLFLNRPLPINRADKDSLEMLPGVGPHLAAAIADELQHQGRFAGPEDLLKVSGIGPKTLQKLLPLVSFD